MKYIECINCLTKFRENKEICPVCSNDKLVIVSKRTYSFNGQSFSKRQWYGNLANFRVVNTEIVAQRVKGSLTPQYVKQILQKNIKEYTFYGIILPIIFFVFLGLLSFGSSFYLSTLAEYVNSHIFALFLGAIFIVFACGLMYQYFVKQQRCYFRFNNLYQYQYTKITKNEINEILNQLENINETQVI